MRRSKRELILECALKVVDETGVSAVTFESVAAVSGLTTSGLLYHFPSKEALLLGMHEHMASLWETDLLAGLEGDLAGASPADRLVAYTRASIKPTRGPELLMILEARRNPALAAPWDEVMERWMPRPDEIQADRPASLRLFAGFLAADGLWLNEALNAVALNDAARNAIAEQIIATALA